MAIFISFMCLANIKQGQGRKDGSEKLKLRGLQESQEIKKNRVESRMIRESVMGE